MHAYWIWLEGRKGLTRRKKLELAARFPDIKALFDKTDFSDLPGLSPAAVQSLQDKDLSREEEVLRHCQEKGIRVLTAGDACYPQRLKGIADPPLVLYYKGTLPDFDREAAVGVVGTRKASAYGLLSAEKLSRQIAEHGGLVVSGMAAGIDAQAGWGAIRAGMPTVAVLGGGVDRIYPASNRELYAAVEACGCLISEYPPGTPPAKWTFPERNRIISGLSCAVLVVEAPEKSGTMITARDAIRQGRELFVVPGHIDSAFCQGSNLLLKDGARLASSGWDVLGEYETLFPDKIHRTPKKAAETFVLPSFDSRMQPPMPEPEAFGTQDSPAAPPAPVGATAEEQAVLEALNQGEQTIDYVIATTGLDSGKALAVLTMMEIKGMVTTLPGRRVIRNS